MEYAVAGSGPPLLMIHGTGGGFDQGLLFTEKLAAHGVRVIAPSRFGYLRSSFPADHSSEAQADAFVALLDHLKLERVVVAGGSAGFGPLANSHRPRSESRTNQPPRSISSTNRSGYATPSR